ncbi:MAG TPA: hypothetical protein VE136_15660 [Anaerolineales bacterium]|jgi:hypothetical protein|nr:hypothetical protein [Anaerolineales bacterium]
MDTKFKVLTAFSVLVFLVLLGVPTAFAHEGHLDLAIDIKPGSYPNTINLKSGGMVPVAVLGSSDFDAGQVVVTSLIFGPMHENHDHLGASPVKAKFDDVNSDGYADLVVFFSVVETGLSIGDTQACLHGMLVDGTHFCGHDSVRVI